MDIPKSVQCILQVDDCLVVLSATTVVVLMIHNPLDWLGKTLRCGIVMVSAENLCNYVGRSSKYNPFFQMKIHFLKTCFQLGFALKLENPCTSPKMLLDLFHHKLGILWSTRHW